jgi:glycosyltransferase involved in cell wall biosynthesis
VQWFANDVFPQLRARFPGLHFYIVGARPSAPVTALGSLPGVTVTGTVPDVRPYILHADVAVAPLRIARGIQNKVLEAMAMASRVVVSPQALEGIDATPGAELILADGAAEFAAAVTGLLETRNTTIGPAARRRVETQYSWPSNLACIGEQLECS